jgi:UDP-N-acetylglucosamine 2-epimerase (non-hydrolysing)
MIHVIIGTKAQLIKMAPILKIMKQQQIEYNYISTGQHQATIDDILSNFEIPSPNYILYSGKDITSIFKMLFWGIRILFLTLINKKAIFRGDTNGIVLVHGDTFSTLLGAIMAKLAGLKVGHVESGLRSFNLFHPFPEELTRLLVFYFSNYMFCPSKQALSNVAKYKSKKIYTQANTLYDSLHFALPIINQIQNITIPTQKFAIITLHRFENIYNQEAITRIVDLVEKISQFYYLLFILHKPTEINLKKFNLYEKLANNPNIEFRPRYDYFHFIKLVNNAYFIVSDGGSNQEECFYLGKPILLLRKATERKEGLEENCVLSEYSESKILNFLNNIESYQFPTKEFSFSPSQIIINACEPFCNKV